MSRTRSAVADVPAVSPPQGHYQRVPIDLLVKSPLNPRKHVDEGKLADLVESIRQHDVIEPIVVRLSPENDAEFEIVAGDRRHQAARLAGLSDVPVMIRSLTDAQLLELALQENIHQASMSAIDEAVALDKLATLDPIYRDPKVLAGKIGRSESYVRDRLRLLRLAPEVRDALAAGAITASHGDRIARLPKEQHAAALRACFSPLLVDHAFEVWEDEIARAKREGLPTVRDEVDALVRAARWDVLAPSVVALRAIDDWIREHGKADVAAPEVQEQLLQELGADGSANVDEATAAAADTDVVATLLQLSEDRSWGFSRKQAKAIGVLYWEDWKAITGKPCGFATRGAVVHGGDLRVVDCCVQKRKCRKHWPEEEKARAAKDTADQRQRQERERQQREAAEARWKAMAPAAFKAFARHVAGIKLTASLVKQIVPSWDLKKMGETFGVTLTDKNAAQVLALCYVSTWSEQQFSDSSKHYGFDLKSFAKTWQAEQDAKGAETLQAGRKQLAAKRAKKGGAK